REEAVLRVRQHRRAQLPLVDPLERADHAQRAQRPAVGADPALQHRDHGQRDQRHGDEPRGDAQDGAHGWPPAEAGMGNGEWGMGVASLHPRATRNRFSGALVPSLLSVIPSAARDLASRFGRAGKNRSLAVLGMTVLRYERALGMTALRYE